MRYLVAMPLRDDQSAEFNALIEKYRHFAPRLKITLGPHVTIIRPGEAKVEAEKAKALFEQIKIDQAKFTVEFKSFDAFLGRNCATYAKPGSTTEFISVRTSCEELATKILTEANDFEFHPHLTLINRLNQVGAEKLLSQLKKLKFQQEFTFERVCLYKKEDTDTMWQILTEKIL